jgi:uncharacterized membrane protein HdeD (DUF308 family)
MSVSKSMTASLEGGLEEIRSSWGWFVALGITLIILGAVCILGNVMATLATVLAFGWLLIIGGVAALIHAFRMRTWSGFFLFLLSAVLRGFTGYLLLRYPLAGELGLTMLLASFFIVGGTFRAIGAGALRFPRWGWTAVSGVVSIVLGVMLLVQLPISSLWFIGLAIGVDFVFDGSSLVALGLALRGIPTERSLAAA